MRDENTFTCDLVIAKYKEDLTTWLPKYENRDFRNIYLYNKNQEDNKKTASDLNCVLAGKECIKINLKNEGRCDHTYLYHIISNYDNLADVTIFTKGSSDMQRERKKLAFTINKVFETHNTVMSVDEHPTPIGTHHANFKLDFYRSSHRKNHTTGFDIHEMKMKPASPRPFGKWFNINFPGIETTKAVYAGVYALSKRHIHQHPKSYYQKFLEELEGHSNPEVGHYLERATVALFSPIEDKFLYDAAKHEVPYRGGSRQKQTRKIKRKQKPHN